MFKLKKLTIFFSNIVDNIISNHTIDQQIDGLFYKKCSLLASSRKTISRD